MKHSNDSGYINFWGIERPKFTEMELALMEGGHSIEPQPKERKFSFLKELQEKKHESE